MPATTPTAARTRRRRRSAEPLALEWRFIPDVARPGSRNMALDHALARCVEPGTGVVRLYAWTRPTVSFGRNEPAAGRYSPEAAEERGIDYVRRPTGGRAVLHAQELTYAVAASVGALGGARAAYRRINAALAEALTSLGIAAELARGAAPRRPDAGPCFQGPAEAEVVAGGRKLIGSAQARIEGALLQHGSIILSGDQSALSELASAPWDHTAPATVEELVGEVAEVELASHLHEAMARAFGGTWSLGDYTASELEQADRLVRERYARGAWTWRR